MNNYTKKTFSTYWQHIKVYKLAGFTIFISIIIGSLANIYAPLLYKEFFDVLTGTLSVTSQVNILVGILGKILIVYLIGWLFWRLAVFNNSYFQTSVMNDLAKTCFAYLHKHSITFFNNNFVGSLVKRVNRFSRAFEGIADAIIWELLPAAINISAIIIVLYFRNIYLGLAILIWIIIYITINYFFSKYKLKYDIEKSKIDSVVTGVLADSITNQQNIKVFTGYDRERYRFNTVVTKLKKMRRFSWDLGNIFEAAQVLLMIFLELGMFYFAVKLWQKGLVTVGDFVLIQTYLLTIFHQLWNFGRVIRHFYEHLADAEEMTEILETPHEIQDIKNAKELKVGKGKIEFIDVDFSYHKTRKVIKKLNLEFKPKERVALVGESGSGKSTIVNLLLRNYDVDSGKIKIDGQKNIEVTQESLRKNIGLVAQDPILFHRSLKENICYGKSNATNEEVYRASKLAHCDKFITKLSEGYGTYVGERGIKLSGGERQRVAIARAILKNAPILVLDEATSSLDSESEELIQDALMSLMKDKTVIVIAHRLSTVMKMDRIIVIEHGMITEQGTHKQLLKKKTGAYHKLWELQVGGFIT